MKKGGGGRLKIKIPTCTGLNHQITIKRQSKQIDQLKDHGRYQ